MDVAVNGSQPTETTAYSDEEMMIRATYLKQDGETKEQREQRNRNVRKLLADSRDSTIGVHDKKLLKSFAKGKGK